MKRKNTSSVLRHRMTLQEEVQTPDGAGGYVRSWDDVTDIWTQLLPIRGNAIRGREFLFAGQLQSTISHVVLIRHREGINAGQRLLFEERIFNIRALIDPDGRKEKLELFVEEGAAA